MEYWIWLSSVPYIGPVTSRILLQVFGDPETVYRSDASDLCRIKGITQKYCHYIPEKVDYKAIGRRIRELWESYGMNREEFGKRTGCSESVITKIELNYSNGSDTILQRIADTFEVGFDWLKYGDEKTHISPVNKKLIE